VRTLEKIMNTTKKLLLLVAIFTLALSACSSKTETEPQPTEVNPEAVFTSAAETVVAKITETAMAFSPTPAPPTETPTRTPTATLVDLNQTPIIIPNGEGTATATLLPGFPTFTPGAPTVAPTATPNLSGGPACDEMTYGSPVDVTIPDGTTMEPGEDFYKIWRIYNTGSCTWDDGYQLVVVSGAVSLDAPNPAWAVTKDIPPGEVVDIGVKLTAPLASGKYQNCFIMQNDRGVYFGGVLCVDIEVVDN
jgi:hypothetical protein